MKSFHTWMLASVLLCADSLFGIDLQVFCEPPLPVENLLKTNVDFESGTKHWNNKHPENAIVPDPVKPDNHVLHLTLPEKSVWQSLSVKPFQSGKSYIASCRIKPDIHVSTARTSMSGIGFSLTFWDETWKKACSIHVHDTGPTMWQKIVGKPATLPDWIKHAQLHVSVLYSQGSGYVDDLCIQEAYATMKIRVKAPTAIRQVKVMDELGNTHVDTGILKTDSLTFDKDVKIQTPHVYSVMVITNDGDVKTVTYPKLGPGQEQP